MENIERQDMERRDIISGYTFYRISLLDSQVIFSSLADMNPHCMLAKLLAQLKYFVEETLLKSSNNCKTFGQDKVQNFWGERDKNRANQNPSYC